MTERDRLNRIIRLERRIRDARRAELAHAEAREGEAEEAVARADARLVRLSARYCETAELSARELAHRAHLAESARRERERARAHLRDAASERERRAAALREAGRAVRSLEVLDQRLAAEQRRAEERREQAASDEHAARGRSVGAAG